MAVWFICMFRLAIEKKSEVEEYLSKASRFVPEPSIIFEKKITKTPELLLTYLERLIPIIKNNIDNGLLSNNDIRAVILFIQGYMAFLTSTPLTITQPHRELLATLVELIKKNTRHLTLPHSVDLLDFIQTWLSDPQITPVFELEVLLYNHFELFISKDLQWYKGSESIHAFNKVLAEKVKALDASLLTETHLARLFLLFETITRSVSQVKLSSKGLTLKEFRSIFDPFINDIFSHMDSGLTTNQRRLKIDDIPIHSRILFHKIEYICKTLDKSDPPQVMSQTAQALETLSVSLIKDLDFKHKTLNSIDILALEMSLTTPIACLLAGMSGGYKSEKIHGKQLQLMSLLRKYQKDLSMLSNIRCMFALTSIINHQMIQKEFKKAYNHIAEIQKYMSQSEFELRLMKLHTNEPYYKDLKLQIKSCKKELDAHQKTLENALLSVVIDTYKKQKIIQLTLADDACLLLKPQMQHIEHFKKHEKFIVKRLRHHGFDICKTILSESYLISNVTQCPFDELIKRLTAVEKDFIAHINAKARHEIKSRIQTLKQEKSGDHEYIHVVSKALEKPLIAEFEHLTTLEVKTEPEHILKPEKEQPHDEFILTDTQQKQTSSTVRYHVKLNEKFIKKLTKKQSHEDCIEYMKLLNVLNKGCFNTSEIFSFKPDKAKKKIKELFDTKEMKSLCVKVKPGHTDIRFFGVMKENKGIQVIEIDRCVRNTH